MSIAAPVHESAPEADGVTSPETMAARAVEAATLLKVLAHPVRLLLACALAEGETSVGDLADRLDIHQPSLSQQLGLLRQHGIVETRRDGKQMLYRLTAAKAARLIEALNDIFCNESTDP